MKIPIFFKSMMTAILFFLIPWEGKATGLSGDVIYLQGEEWVLLDKPINRDSILFHRLMEFLPDNHCITTANWGRLYRLLGSAAISSVSASFGSLCL